MALRDAYFAAVRSDDAASIERLLRQDPSLSHARWPGRGRPDGKMRSLGPTPFNQHTWIEAPINPDDPQDPRYTSTPLIWSRDDAIVRLLVEHGADVNARGTSGEIELLDWFYTPLWRAAHDGRLGSVRLLVEHGADVNVLNPDGTNQALITAIENGAVEVAHYLLANGAIPDAHSAAMLGLIDDVARNIQADPSCVQGRDSYGRSLLDAATLMDSSRVPWPQTDSHDRVADLLMRRDGLYQQLVRREMGRLTQTAA